jgi:hypothetical protein
MILLHQLSHGEQRRRRPMAPPRQPHFSPTQERAPTSFADSAVADCRNHIYLLDKPVPIQ